MSTHPPKDAYYEMIAEETLTAHKAFPYYSTNVIIPPMHDTPNDRRRALFQTFFRVQHLRIEAARQMAEAFGIAIGSSAVETEKQCLRFMAMQIAEGTDNPDQILGEIQSMFGVEMPISKSEQKIQTA